MSTQNNNQDRPSTSSTRMPDGTVQRRVGAEIQALEKRLYLSAVPDGHKAPIPQSYESVAIVAAKHAASNVSNGRHTIAKELSTNQPGDKKTQWVHRQYATDARGRSPKVGRSVNANASGKNHSHRLSVLHPSPVNPIYTMAVQHDGKILVAGVSGGKGFGVTRFDASGERDTGFGNNGVVTVRLGAGNAIAYAVAVDETGSAKSNINYGKILLAGAHNGQFLVVRLNANGTLDKAFGHNGKVSKLLSGSANALVVLRSGMILVGAGIGNSQRVVQLDGTGHKDLRFGKHGVYRGSIDKLLGREHSKGLLHPDGCGGCCGGGYSVSIDGGQVSEADSPHYSGTVSISGNDAGPWTVNIDWGDNETESDPMYNTSMTVTHDYPQTFEEVTYPINVSVTDQINGKPGSASASFNVVDSTPSVSFDNGNTQNINEGHTLNAGGSFSDFDPNVSEGISYSATVDYGDGGGSQPLELSGNRFTLSHVYNSEGSYNVNVTVNKTEDGVGSSSGPGTLTVNVNDVTPSVSITAGTAITEGQSVGTTGSFTGLDPDATYSAMVDYGDNSGAQNLPLTMGQNGATFTLSHSYLEDGTFVAHVTVTGSEGDDASPLTGTAQVTVTVAEAPVTLSGAYRAEAYNTWDPSYADYTLNPTQANPTDALTNLTINWGDGSAPVQYSGSLPASVSHRFLDPALTDVITATATDDNTTISSLPFPIAVQQGPLVISAVTNVNVAFKQNEPIPDNSGFMEDLGYVFGDRGHFAQSTTDYCFGWTSDVSTTSVHRTASDPVGYDDFIPMPPEVSGQVQNSWSIGLANGTYQVTVLSGDPTVNNFSGYDYQTYANGVQVTAGTPTQVIAGTGINGHWIQGTATVTVSNGWLSVYSGPNANNNVINTIQITPTTHLSSVPSAPSGLTAYGESTTAINLNWTDTSDNESGYKVERFNGSTYTVLTNPPLPSNTTFYQDTGLSPGTTYSYRVVATNSVGDSTPASVNGATLSSNNEAPYKGVMPVLGTGAVTIQAEDFDTGGDGVGYHDTTAANLGGRYRGTTVDIGTAGPLEQGYFVGWNESTPSPGDWYNYTVNVQTAGKYLVDFRVASDGSGGIAHVTLDNNTTIIRQFSIPDTGGWNEYETLSFENVQLPAGQHVLTLHIDANGPGEAGNFDWLRFTPEPAVPPAPQFIYASAISDTTVNLRWTDESSSATGYTVQRSSNNGTSWSTLSSNLSANATSYTDTTAQGGTQYLYQVLAVNAQGSSASSLAPRMRTPIATAVAVPVTADAFVSGAAQSTNYGSANDLEMQDGGSTAAQDKVFLNFNFSSVTGTISGVKLRMYGGEHSGDQTGIPVNISPVSGNWGESTITWSSAAAGLTIGTPLATTTVNENGQTWYEWDITSYVQAQLQAHNTSLSFMLQPTVSTPLEYLAFRSRESATNAPVILVSTSAGGGGTNLNGPSFTSQPPSSAHINPYAPPPPVTSPDWTQGEVLVSANPVYQFTPDGMDMHQNLSYPQMNTSTGLAFDRQGTLLVTEFVNHEIAQFNPWQNSNSSQSGTIFYNGSTAPIAVSTPESIVFDGLGNMYVSDVTKPSGGPAGIVKMNPQGQVVEEFARGMEVDWLDLAADEHTLYFTDEVQYAQGSQTPILQVHTLDTNTGIIDKDTNGVATPFATLPYDPAAYDPVTNTDYNAEYALRVLPNGGIHVTTDAGGDGVAYMLVAEGAHIWALNAQGVAIKHYDFNPYPDTSDPNYSSHQIKDWFALNLDPDGHSFWSASLSYGVVAKFDIATGTVIEHFTAGSFGNPIPNIGGLAVYGEITAAQAASNQPIVYDAHATDPYNNTITYSLSSADSKNYGATIDAATGIMNWLPTATGTFTFTITATDTLTGLSATQTFPIQVNTKVPDEDPPVISTTQDQFTPPDPSGTGAEAAQVGLYYTNRVQASNKSGDNLIYSLVNTPGFTIDPQTGTIGFLPTADQVGIHTITVQVTDPRGGVAQESYTLQVNPAPGSTSLHFLPVNLPPATVGQPFLNANQSAVTLAVPPDSQHVITFLPVAVPPGMYIVPDSGEIRWTPNADQVGSQTFTVEAVASYGSVPVYSTQQTFTVNVQASGTAARMVNTLFVQPYMGVPFSGATIAQVYDPPPNDGQYHAVLDWGDGSPTLDSASGQLTITADPTSTGWYDVSVPQAYAHTYSGAGPETAATIAIHESNNSVETFNLKIDVIPPSLQPPKNVQVSVIELGNVDGQPAATYQLTWDIGNFDPKIDQGWIVVRTDPTTGKRTNLEGTDSVLPPTYDQSNNLEPSITTYDQGITPERYQYQVYTVDNWFNLSRPSETVTAPDATASVATPTSLSAVGGGGFMTLNWDNTSSSNIQGWVVRRAPDTSNHTPPDPKNYVSVLNTDSVVAAPGLGVNTVNFDDDTVTVGQSYWYEIAAVDNAGNQSAFATLNAAVTVTAQGQVSYSVPTPGIPVAGFAGAVNGTARIGVAWTPVSATGFLGYNLYRGTTSDFSADGSNLIFMPADAFYTDDMPATPVGTYYYRVQAVATDGQGDEIDSPISAASAGVSTGVTLTTAPPAPSNLVGTANTDGSITLSWTDNSINEMGFEIRRLDSGNWDAIGRVTQNATTFTDSNTASVLIPGNSYEYEVVSYDAGANGAEIASSPSNIATVTIPTVGTAPGAPTNLKATPSANQISLTWTASPTPTNSNNVNDSGSDTSDRNALIGYYVYRQYGGSSNPWYRLTATPIITTTYTDTSVQPGTAYSYEVTAVSAGYAQSQPATLNPSTVSTTSSDPLAQITAPQSFIGMTADFGGEAGTLSDGEGASGVGGTTTSGDGRIESETAVTGIVDGPTTGLTWTLYLRPVDTNSQTFSKSDIVLTSGHGPIGNARSSDGTLLNPMGASLGILDPSQYPNGNYELFLEANVGTTTIDSPHVTVSLFTAGKVGNLTLPVTDLTVDVPGAAPIVIQRIYDSQDANTTEDFGSGWRLDVSNTAVSTTARPVSPNAYGSGNTLRPGDLVYITLPDGTQHAFEFLPVPASYSPNTDPYNGPSGVGYAVGSYYIQFVCADGSGATLSVPGDINSPGFANGDRLLLSYDQPDNEFFLADGSGFTPYNPANPSFKGIYTVTTIDHQDYTLSSVSGAMISYSDANNNVTNYSDTNTSVAGNSDRVQTISGGTNGPQVQISRDPSSNHIDSISVTQNGVTRTVQYAYQQDNSGNWLLHTVTDNAHNTTTYTYQLIDGASYLTNVAVAANGGTPATTLSATYSSSPVQLVTLKDGNGKTLPVNSGGEAGSQSNQGATTPTTYDAGQNPLGDQQNESTKTIYDSHGGIARTIQSIHDATGNLLGYEVNVTQSQYMTADLGSEIDNIFQSTNNGVQAGFSLQNALASQATYAPFLVSVTTPGDPNSEATAYQVALTDNPVAILSRTDYNIAVTGNGFSPGLLQPFRQIQYLDGGRAMVTSYPTYTPLGQPTSMNVDLYPSVDASNNPSGTPLHISSTTSQYDSRGNLTQSTDAKGVTTFYVYTTGQTPDLYNYVYTGDGVTSVDYSGLPAGLLLETYEQLQSNGPKIPLGKNVYSISSDPTHGAMKGMLASTTDAAGKTTYTAYTPDGRVAMTYYQVTDPNPTNWANDRWVAPMNQYDADGRVVATRQASYGVYSSSDLTLHFSIDTSGTFPTVWPAIDTTKNAYDNKFAAGPVTTSQTTYDSNGRVSSTVDQYNATTSTVYDNDGNTIQVTSPDGTETRSVYDVLGRLIWQTDKFNPADNTTPVMLTYTVYDGLGRASQTQRWQGTNNSITITSTGADTGTSTIATTGANAPVEISFSQSFYDDQGRVIESDSNMSPGDTTGASGLRTGTMYYPDGQVQFSGPLASSAHRGGNVQVNSQGIETISFGQGDFQYFTTNLSSQVVSTTTTASVAMPNVGTSVVVNVQSKSGLLVGQPVEISASGFAAGFIITAISGTTNQLTLQNSGWDLATGLLNPTTSIPNNATVRVALPFNRATDPLLHSADTFTDTAGQSVRTLFADGSFTETLYSDKNGVVPAIDAEGETLTLPSMSDGWPTNSATLPAGDTATIQIAQRKSSDPPIYTISLYDDAGRLTDVWQPAVTDAISNQSLQPHWHYTYDQSGNELSQVDPKGNTTSWTYDEFNDKLSRTLPEGQTGGLYQGSQTESWTYDQFNRVESHTDFDNQMTLEVYDNSATGDGRLRTEFRYTSSFAFPIGFDPANPPSGTWPNWFEKTEYTYDGLGRQQEVDDDAFGGSSPVQSSVYTYDPITGNVASIATPQGTVHYAYDPVTGRKVRMWTTGTGTNASTIQNDTAYAYDTQGRLIDVYGLVLNGTTYGTYGNSINSTTHNPTFSGSPLQVSYQYDNDGNLHVEDQLGTTTTFGYDSLNRLTSLTSASDSSGTNVFSEAYILRDDGMRSQATDTGYNSDGSTFSQTVVTWNYDALDRLTDETLTAPQGGSNAPTQYHDHFAFDLDGNRTEEDADTTDSGTYNQKILYNYNKDNELTLEQTDNYAGGTVTSNSSLQYQITYGYDHNGSMTSQSRIGSNPEQDTYFYDLRNRLKQAEHIASGSPSTDNYYTYDTSGVRAVETLVNHVLNESFNTYDLNDPQNPTGYAKAVQEMGTAGGNPSRSYLLGLSVEAQQGLAVGQAAPPFGATWPHNPLVLLHDGHGSTRTALEVGGNAAQFRFDYDAYGTLLSGGAISSPTPWLYAGDGVYDGYTGWTYSLARWRDGSHWTQADSITTGPGQLDNANLYAYVAGDPLNASDPSGHSLIDTLGSITLGQIVDALPVIVVGAMYLGKEFNNATFAASPTTRQNAVPTIDKQFAWLARDSYNKESDPLTTQGWTLVPPSEIIDADFTVGSMQARLYQSGNRYALVFRGTRTLDLGDELTNFSQGLMGPIGDTEYEAAVELATRVSNQLGRTASLTMVGHSLGGGLADAAALATNRPAVTFNAAGLNPLSESVYSGGSVFKDPQYHSFSVNYNVQGEFLTTLERNIPIMPEASGLNYQNYTLIPSVQDTDASSFTLHGIDCVLRAMGERVGEPGS